MSGRLDLMLAEIAHLQDDCHSKEEWVGQTELQSPPQASPSQNSEVLYFTEPLNTASPCTPQGADAIDDSPSVVSATEEEPPPAESVVSAHQKALDSGPDAVMLSVGGAIADSW
jgi:hypothetical protein